MHVHLAQPSKEMHIKSDISSTKVLRELLETPK
jgi:hypothetical protein